MIRDAAKRRGGMKPDPWAAALGALAWVTLIAQYFLSIDYWVCRGLEFGQSTMKFFTYFTVVTNALMAVCLSIPILRPGTRAAKWSASPMVLSGIAASTLLVAIYYEFFLRKLWHPEGLQFVTDLLLHDILPVGFLIWWFLRVQKGCLRAIHVATWFLYPLFYLIWVLTTGMILRSYPYPFLNPAKLGPAATALNIGCASVFFLTISVSIFLVDRSFGKIQSRRSRLASTGWDMLFIPKPQRERHPEKTRQKAEAWLPFFFAVLVSLNPTILFANSDAEHAATNQPPGIVVASSAEPEKLFVASPSLTRLDTGSLLVSHDWSGPGANGTRTTIWRSEDHGATWHHLADVTDIRWASLFTHRGALYLLGVSRSFGNIVIRRSGDGGRTWILAENETTGVLRKGRFHTAPVPVLLDGGRLWRAFEEQPNPRTRRAFSAFVLSAPEKGDLLRADTWRASNAIPFDADWLNIRSPEWIEGNVVKAPDGTLLNILRTNTHPGIRDQPALSGGAAGLPRYEVAAAPALRDQGRSLVFDPATDFRHLPGAQSKFTIRHDPISKLYWTIAQKITARQEVTDWATSPHHQRNVLVLQSSPDLRTWTERRVLLSHRPGQTMTKANRIGFQYADWIFDGDDLLFVSRTAWGARNYHDANLITFHRVKNFRSLAEGSPVRRDSP